MKGLTSKIVAFIGGALFLLFIITGTVISLYNRQSFTSNEEQLLKNTGDWIAEKVGRYFDRYITMVETMATDQNVVRLMETAHAGDSDHIEQNAYFDAVYQMLTASRKLEEDSIQTTYVADVDANVLFDSDLWISGREGEAYDVATREWYKSVSEKRLFISEPYEDVNTKNQVVTISTPVYSRDGSEVLGITAVDIEISRLTDMVKQQTLGDSGFIMLCSPLNVILSHRDENMVLKHLEEAGLDSRILNAVKNSDTAVLEYKIGNTAMIGNFQPIGDTGWKIVSAMPKKAFNANIVRNLTVIVSIYAVGMLLMLFVLFMIARIIVNPLRRLTEATDLLAAGNLDAEVAVRSGDEAGRLAVSLGSLTGRLKEYIAYINEISAALYQFSQGNLNIELKQSYVGEFEKIKRSMLQMSQTIQGLMGQIAEAAQEVNDESEQMAEGARSLADGAAEQASSIEEITAAIGGMAGQVEMNYEDTKSAACKVAEVEQSIDLSSRKLKEMISAMDEISGYSRNIGKIIETIQEIASQTNMLALNAAIEAARAGEQGKGFAVIAGNVRELAAKSSAAAQNTTEMIENTIKSVENGTNTAEDAAAAMSLVVEGSKEVVDKIDKVSITLEAGTESIKQFRAMVEQVAEGIQENSKTAQESAAFSGELSKQAQILKELVGRFH